MAEAKEALSLLKVPDEKVHKESFGTAHTVGEVVEQDDDGSLKAQEITVLYEGSE